PNYGTTPSLGNTDSTSHKQRSAELDDHSRDFDYQSSGRPRCLHALNREKSQLPNDTRSAPKVLKQTSSSAKGTTISICPHCPNHFPSASTLSKHVLSAHSRPFTCPFRRYGCSSSFGSKNEWKRHVSSQHIHLGIWRCDVGACVPQSAMSPGSADNNTGSKETRSNDFNRKDLFTQHLRRMHGPGFAASRSEKEAFDSEIEAIRARCWVPLRDPPPKSICPYCAPHPSRPPSSSSGEDDTPLTMVGDAPVVFDGQGSWDERMEHVGRHLEKGDPGVEVEDLELKEWMCKEGLISLDRGEWTIVGTGVRKRPRGSKDAEEDIEGEGD
ncbi:MAG: hypothetical protein Q9209_000184, partial [Squamulea sp. 1 TL-2023]